MTVVRSKLIMKELKVSYSGIRGIVPDNLDENVAYCYGLAFGQLLRRRFESYPLVVMGMDTRQSGPSLKTAMMAGLEEYNCRLIDIGIIPTPTLDLMMRHHRADGGVIVTASHNPAQWNGFKFLIGPETIILDGPQIRELNEYYSKTDFLYNDKKPEDVVFANEEALRVHQYTILEHVDVPLIKSCNFKVAYDSGRGAGQIITNELLEILGCNVIDVNALRDSEPSPQNITELCDAVKKHNCNIGFAQDLDADRLAIVSEEGIPLGEEYTLALAIQHLLERFAHRQPVVVKNSSTSRMIGDLATMYDAPLIVTKVGEVNLSKELKKLTDERRIAFGGEGNGGVIYPPVNYGRDSLIGIALLLEFIAKKQKKISKLAKMLPQYFMIKKKIELEDRSLQKIFLRKFQDHYKDYPLSFLDGIKVTFRDGSWAQARASNTEPVVRLIAESYNKDKVQFLIDEIMEVIGNKG